MLLRPESRAAEAETMTSPSVADENDQEANARKVLAMWDDLPSSAFVKRRVVEILFGNISDEEVRRRSKDGRIPKPTKLGSRVNIWQVGQLRAALAKMEPPK
jgi:predicted DNA-binding transcriptional regulator AlpA